MSVMASLPRSIDRSIDCELTGSQSEDQSGEFNPVAVRQVVELGPRHPETILTVDTVDDDRSQLQGN